MFVTVVALMCQLYSGIPVCHEVIVTDSDQTPTVDFMACLMAGMPAISQWKINDPKYSKDSWYIGRYKCVQGHYLPKDQT